MAQTSGDLTATGSVTLTKPGVDTLTHVQISGTYGTVTFVIEGSADGTTYAALAAVGKADAAVVTGTLSPADNATLIYDVPSVGLSKVRARVTAIASGTASFSLTSGAYVGVPSVSVVSGSAFAGTTFASGVTLSGATGVNSVAIPDNLADAFNLKQGANSYIKAVTTDSSEAVELGKKTRLVDSAKLSLGDGDDVTVAWDGTDLDVLQATPNSSIKVGVSGAGIDVVMYGDTAGYNMTWDQSADSLIFNDNAKLALGDSSDVVVSWDNTRLNVTQATPDSEIRWGVDGAGIDQRWYGDTASASLLWDQSADKLVLNGVAKIQHQTIAAATGTAIPVTHSGSFPITQNGAETNTLADPTFLGQWLTIFVDTDTSGARVITAASRINQAGNTLITLTEVGDFLKLEAITIAGALKWQVVANDGAVLA